MSAQYSDYRIGFELAIQHGKVIGQTRREALQNFVETDTFFKTLFRKDHPFLTYTVREKGESLEYRIDALLLPHVAPMFCSIPLLTGLRSADYAIKYIKNSFYAYAQNYLIDVIHADTEKRRDALTLYNAPLINYDSILLYLEQITQNISFLKTSFFNDAEEIGLLIETRGNFSMIEPIELIWNKDKLVEMVAECRLKHLNPSDELKKYFNNQITANLHRAKAPIKTPVAA